MQFAEITILVRLGVGALGTFCAILLWSRSRDLAWALVVIGVLVSYVGTIHDTLDGFGLVEWPQFEMFGLPGLPLMLAVLDNLPVLLYSLAFIVVLVRGRAR